MNTLLAESMLESSTAGEAAASRLPSGGTCEVSRRSIGSECRGTILIVDDEPINIKVAQKYLAQAGYKNFLSTSEPREAVGMVRRDEPDVIILDVMMPDVSGLEILEVIRADQQMCHLPVLILTAAADEQTKTTALELGATDFLTKPVNPSELVPRVRNALIVKAHHDHMAQYSSQLEREVRERTRELAESRLEVIRVLACAAEYRDKETGNHVLRVGRYAGIIARELGFSASEAEQLEQAAILHDVGKIGITDSILLKPGRLDRGEIAMMQNHCKYGANILRGIPSDGKRGKTRVDEQFESVGNSPILTMAARIAMSHHEKWDGSGYPLGLSGDSIPVEGRITAVADVFDALRSRRPYKDAIPLNHCFELLQEGRGRDFDPRVLDAFLALKIEVMQIAEELADA